VNFLSEISAHPRSTCSRAHQDSNEQFLRENVNEDLGTFHKYPQCQNGDLAHSNPGGQRTLTMHCGHWPFRAKVLCAVLEGCRNR